MADEKPKGSMITPNQLRRLFLFSALLVIGYGALAYRLIDIQVWQHPSLASTASRITHYTEIKQTRRGEIYDRNGNLLATCANLKILCADPGRIGDYYPQVARALAPLVGIDEARLRSRLKPRWLVNSRGRRRMDPHVRLKVRVSPETWGEIRARMASLRLVKDEASLPASERRFLATLRRSAIFTEPVDALKRVYPQGTLAAHVLGFVRAREGVFQRQSVFVLHGAAGVEKSLDRYLQGAFGWRKTEADRHARELVRYRSMDVDPREGLNAVLTIDLGLQFIVEEELAAGVNRHHPLSATVIAVRPSTGEVLAMANYPTYDPNDPGAVAADHRRNRAIMDQLEPGSTFKTISISSALNEGVVGIQDRFFCENGRMWYAGSWLTDTHPYGWLSVKKIIVKSSNIGAFKIARRLGRERLYRHIRAFGFGERTGIALPGEASGTVHPLAQWRDISISRVPMGYEIAVTPLQLTMAIAAIANRGRLMVPMIVSRLEDREGNGVAQYHPQAVYQVISPETARLMKDSMVAVVSKEGTARRAWLEHYIIAGKTGTANKSKVGKRGYAPGKYYASFVGFFPAEDPQLCISVIFNEPKGSHYGGSVAAPVFREIARRAANYLSIRPSESTRREVDPSSARWAVHRAGTRQRRDRLD